MSRILYPKADSTKMKMKVKVQLGPEKMGANMEVLREAVIRTVGTLQQKRKQLLNCGEAEVRGQNRIMMLRAYCQSQTVELRGGKHLWENLEG